MSLYFVLPFWGLRGSKTIIIIFGVSNPYRIKVTVGLWWRWQDLNLRPWDYDSPALSRIKQKSRVFLVSVNVSVNLFV